MIQPLLYPATADKPQVILDPKNNIFEFSGRSFPADAKLFYQPILNWLEDYAKNPNPETLVIMRMDYFNSSSAKRILEVILILSEIYKAGHIVSIEWYYQKSDEMILEMGEDLKYKIDVPIELKPY